MPLYITISEGYSAERARPILVTGDPRLVRALMDAIRRLGESDEAQGGEAPEGDGQDRPPGSARGMFGSQEFGRPVLPLKRPGGQVAAKPR